jgi:putative transposase
MQRWYKNLRTGCIRVTTPPSLEGARRFVAYYKTVRLHSAIAYITPADKLAGRAEAIGAARRRKLATSDARRRATVRENEVDQPRCCDVH